MKNQSAIIKILFPSLNIQSFDYRWEHKDSISVGDIVKVPYRQSEKIGVVWEVGVVSELNNSRIRSVISKLPILPLDEKLIIFIKKVAEYNFTYESNILKMALSIKNIEKCLPNEEEYNLSYNIMLPQLSMIQEKAANQICSYIEQEVFKVSLLEGVTGSGKTEVYFKAIAEVIEKKKGQALILMPEIVLTSQFIERFEKRFGFKPASWHSSLKPKEKREIWNKIHTGEIKALVGARSALFLPFKKLALIVIDEEHDTSYKQEEGTIYHARDMAILRGYIEKFSVVLVSATPSIESILNVRSGKYAFHYLESRFGRAVMPEYKVVDMKTNHNNKKSWISQDLKNEIVKALQQGKQSLLFLNRRGYAPLTLCVECGHRFLCPTCDVWMVYHKKKNCLKCHHCDRQFKLPDTCPNCKKEDSFIPCGPGVERIEEEIRKLFPNANIATLTRDTVTKVEEAEEIIKQILSGQIDIIIGTQMIAKGHHFPKLHLVGIIDADLGLLGGDLRAAEKMFQLLHQVSGRAGRESQRGKVLIQTYNKDNDLIKYLMNDDKRAFIDYEINTRMHALMPPFSKLIAIIISGPNLVKVKETSSLLVRTAPISKGVTIMGPAPAILERIRGRYRYRILIKADKNVDSYKYLQHWLNEFKTPSNVRIKVDIDPYNFF